MFDMPGGMESVILNLLFDVFDMFEGKNTCILIFL